jgi:hypothetical protein
VIPTSALSARLIWSLMRIIRPSFSIMRFALARASSLASTTRLLRVFRSFAA